LQSYKVAGWGHRHNAVCVYAVLAHTAKIKQRKNLVYGFSYSTTDWGGKGLKVKNQG